MLDIYCMVHSTEWTALTSAHNGTPLFIYAVCSCHAQLLHEQQGAADEIGHKYTAPAAAVETFRYPNSKSKCCLCPLAG